jgi:hypothetical protein
MLREAIPPEATMPAGAFYGQEGASWNQEGLGMRADELLQIFVSRTKNSKLTLWLTTSTRRKKGLQLPPFLWLLGLNPQQQL